MLSEASGPTLTTGNMQFIIGWQPKQNITHCYMVEGSDTGEVGKDYEQGSLEHWSHIAVNKAWLAGKPPPQVFLLFQLLQFLPI